MLPARLRHPLPLVRALLSADTQGKISHRPCLSDPLRRLRVAGAYPSKGGVRNLILTRLKVALLSLPAPSSSAAPLPLQPA